MSRNIDDFNLAVATILAELYRNFPNKISLCAGDFPEHPKPPETDGEVQRWNEETDRWLYLVDLYNHTAYFLLDEGYVRGRVTEQNTPVYDCRLERVMHFC